MDFVSLASSECLEIAWWCHVSSVPDHESLDWLSSSTGCLEEKSLVLFLRHCLADEVVEYAILELEICIECERSDLVSLCYDGGVSDSVQSSSVLDFIVHIAIYSVCLSLDPRGSIDRSLPLVHLKHHGSVSSELLSWWHLLDLEPPRLQQRLGASREGHSSE